MIGDAIFFKRYIQIIIIILTSCIPQSQFYMFAVYFHVGDIVFKNGGDIKLKIINEMKWNGKRLSSSFFFFFNEFKQKKSKVSIMYE